MTKPVIAPVAEHAGFALKNVLRDRLDEQGLTTTFAVGRHARRVAKLHQVAEAAVMPDRSSEVAV